MMQKFTQSLYILLIILSTSSIYSQNLLTNGDFESGGNGVGFNINSCCYNAVVPSGNTTPGNYAVTNNPFPMNTANFIAGTDHSGTGNMLVVDGTSTGGQQRFWRAGNSGGGVCGLTVGTTYTFSYWIKSVSNSGTPANIGYQFNNTSNVVLVSGSATAPAAAAGWQQVVYTFTATNACVNIELWDNNVNVAGNDFAIDDISLTPPAQPLSIKYSIINITCPGSNDGSIRVYGMGGTPPYVTYTLSGPSSASNNNGFFGGLAPGSYTVSVTDSNGTPVSQAGVIVPNPTDLTVSASASICAGTSKTLSVSGSNGTYTWTAVPPDASLTTPNSASPTVSPTQTTVYTVTSTNTSPNNLIYNGDFFLGDVGFTSDYNYYATNIAVTQKAYGVVSNPSTWEPGFSPCVDHTNGSGKMLVVDGSIFNSGNDKLWCQTVPVTPGQNYNIDYWIQTLATPNAANIEVTINGVSVGTSVAPAAACGWVQKSHTWNSGVSTSAQICFYDRNTALAGNDFAIDDISFVRTAVTCNLQKTVTITIVPNPITLTIHDPNAVCSPSTVDITAAAVTAGSTAGTTLSYWTNAAATTPFTIPPASAITTSGTYYIKSTDAGGCYVIQPVHVTVSTAVSTPLPTVTSPVRYCVGSTPVALTATPAAGATLNWYLAATGGSPLPAAPTPSTLTSGVTTYYVSQTIGTCESGRAVLQVYVAKTAYNIFCSVAVPPVPNSVYFDWTNIISPPPVYHYTYSINGGPPVTGSTNLSGLVVTGVLPNQSVTLTIDYTDGFPCVPPESDTCPNCSSSTVPTFSNIPTSICSGTAAPPLPTTSDNGILGTWSPATVSNTTAGSYTFTPDPILFPCASKPVKNIAIATPPVAATLGGIQGICIGSTTTFTSSATGGTWHSSNTGVATINATGVITGVTAGTSDITYTVPGTGGCSAVPSAIRTVTVTAPPATATLGGTPNICIGGTTALTATIAGGTWTTNAAAIATVNASGVVTGVTAGTATISYAIAGTGGCGFATSSIIITVTAPPNAGALSGSTNVCVGSTSTLTPSVTGGTWSSANTFVATVNASGVVSGVAVGSANIVYTVPGTGGCSAVSTSPTNITVTAPTAAATINGILNICVAQTSSLSASIAGGTWSTNNAAVATVSATGLVTGVTGGTATITYTLGASGGCGPVASNKIITVTAPPNAGTLSGTQGICIGSTTTFITTGASGGTWTSSNTTVATVNAGGVITGLAAGIADITYTVAGSGGCSSATSPIRTVTVTAPPTAAVLSGTQNVCVGSTLTLTTTVTGGTWTSSNTTAATINASTGLINGAAAGVTNITYTLTGTGGCANVPTSLPVTVIALPSSGTLSGNQTICSGSSDTLAPFTSTVSGGTWTSGNAAIATINTTTGVITGVAPGTATMTYTVTSSGCTSIPATRTVTITPKIRPLFSAVYQPICQGGTAPVLPTSDENVPPITGTWSPAINTTILGPTTYTFTPTAGQCVDTSLPTKITLTVVGITATNFTALPAFCEGDAAPVLSNTSPNLVVGTWNPPVIDNTYSVTPRSYLFTPNSGQCATSQTLTVTINKRTVPVFAQIPPFCKGGTPVASLSLTSQNGINGTWTPAVINNQADTSYTFRADAGQCATQQTMIISVIIPTDPGFTDPISVCTGSTPPILLNTSPSGVNGTWAPAVIDNINDGHYDFTPDAGECANTQRVDVFIRQYTLVAIQGVVTNYFEDNQVITVLATNAGNYLYQLDGGLVQTSNVFENVGIGTHTITVMDAYGCSPSLSDDVLVINYPKFFTPNDDSYNDTWNIFGLSNQQNSKILIFDRYGKLIKEISPGGRGWDGTYNGQALPSDDYWFSVDYLEKGISKSFKAHFSLKR